MKGIILSGGRRADCLGVRSIRLETSLLQKEAALLAEAGVDELLVILPEGDALELRGFPSGLKLQLRSLPPELSSAEKLLNCADFAGNEDFWLVYGSVLWNFDLSPTLALHRARRAAATLTLAHSLVPHTAADRDSFGKVLYFEQDPPLTRCDGAAVSAGIVVCSPEIFSYLHPHDDLDLDTFPFLMDQGRLWAAAASGYWKELDLAAGASSSILI